jgi:integrase
MPGDNIRTRYYYPLLERAGLPKITFHELRHAFATLQLTSGTPAKVVQEVLGHSSIVQTLDTYSHVVASLQDEAANRLRDRLFGG